PTLFTLLTYYPPLCAYAALQPLHSFPTRRSSDLSIDVKANTMRKFNDAIQEQIDGTVWQAGCTSWYQNASGKNTNNWPTFTFKYRALTHSINPKDYHFETA